MPKIIDAAHRFTDRQKALPGKASQENALEDRLRAITRLPLGDRPLLAERLGEIAVQLMPENPLQGARQMMRGAWGDDKWSKRKRLIRLPGETASDPMDPGSYEASGATWAALIQSCAHLLFDKGDQTVAAKESARLTRKILRGTSLLLEELELPEGAEGVRDFLNRYSIRICEQMQERTKIGVLWNELKYNPFWTAHRRDGIAPVNELDHIASAATKIATPRWLPGTQLRFTHQLSEATGGAECEWANPTLKIGAMAKKVKRRIFILPPEISELLFDEDEDGCTYICWNYSNPIESCTKVGQWLISIGASPARISEKFKKWEFKLPDTPYNSKNRYGWRDQYFEETRNVWIEVRRKSTGELGIWCEVASVDGGGDLIPFSDNEDIAKTAIEKQIGPNKEFFTWRSDMFYSYLEVLELPEWAGYLSVMNQNYSRMAGVVDTYDDNPFWIEQGCSGWVDDIENDEIAAMLFGQVDNVRFVPLIAQDFDGSVPLPCPGNSIAAALLRNLRAPHEERIGIILSAQAHAIAEAGLGYQRAVLEHYQTLLDEV